MPRIVALSDLHLSPTHGFFWENWRIARDFANIFSADAHIINGDLCMYGPESDAEMEFAASAIKELKGPVFVLPGNHDVGHELARQDHRQFVDSGRIDRWRRHFGPDCWTLDAGPWCLFGLNAQLLGSGLPEETEQMRWFEREVEASSAPHLGLFLHKPLFVESAGEAESGGVCVTPAPREALLKILRQLRVKLVVSGHLHQSRDRMIDGIRHVWLPAVSFATSHPLGGDPRCGVVVMDLTEEGEIRLFLERPVGLVSHDLDTIKQHGRYASLRDMPPCPPPGVKL